MVAFYRPFWLVGRLCTDPTEEFLSGHRGPDCTSSCQVFHIGEIFECKSLFIFPRCSLKYRLGLSSAVDSSLHRDPVTDRTGKPELGLSLLLLL